MRGLRHLPAQVQNLPLNGPKYSFGMGRSRLTEVTQERMNRFINWQLDAIPSS